MADITLVNLNMLFMRYGEEVERELHVPLGPLYLTRALEDAGFAVDFRDYQCVDSDEPFDMEVFLNFLRDPAPVIGLSCMANLLPFTILAMRAIRAATPTGSWSWAAWARRRSKRSCWPASPGSTSSAGARPSGPRRVAPHDPPPRRPGRGRRAFLPQQRPRTHTPDRPRISDLDSIPFPAFEKVDLARYKGYGMMTSRGCPYPCTFCSVAPVWNFESYSRSPRNIVAEMEFLNREAGVDLFLFQDEFFVSGKRQVMEFCGELQRRGLKVQWKAFGRVNLVDEEMMRAMADSGCVELRFGIESGSDRILQQIKRGLRRPRRWRWCPRPWRSSPAWTPFSSGASPSRPWRTSTSRSSKWSPSGCSVRGSCPACCRCLPQTEIYREWAGAAELEFCPYLLPEFVFTGHEVCRGGRIELPQRYGEYFDLITKNPDIFPGFFHIDLAGNVLPKLALLRQFGFYPEPEPARPPRGGGELRGPFAAHPAAGVGHESGTVRKKTLQ